MRARARLRLRLRRASEQQTPVRPRHRGDGVRDVRRTRTRLDAVRFARLRQPKQRPRQCGMHAALAEDPLRHGRVLRLEVVAQHAAHSLRGAVRQVPHEKTRVSLVATAGRGVRRPGPRSVRRPGAFRRAVARVFFFAESTEVARDVLGEPLEHAPGARGGLGAVAALSGGGGGVRQRRPRQHRRHRRARLRATERRVFLFLFLVPAAVHKEGIHRRLAKETGTERNGVRREGLVRVQERVREAPRGCPRDGPGIAEFGYSARQTQRRARGLGVARARAPGQRRRQHVHPEAHAGRAQVRRLGVGRRRA